MKINIYAIKDQVTGQLANPFYMQNDEQAKREFKIAVQEDKKLNLIKEDLQLFKLGEFDDETGQIKSKVEFLMNATTSVEEYRKLVSEE